MSVLNDDNVPLPQAKRFLGRANIRNATFILPKTGERVRRNFTLRKSTTIPNGNGNETTPLLLGSQSTYNHHQDDDNLFRLLREAGKVCYEAVNSRTGRGVLKCSIAYLIASLATLVPPISSLLGRNDGKHMVATVCVYFHPARSAGSMIEATLLALIAFAYAAVVSFSSMAVSAFFGYHDLLAIGHIIVLVVFCGGGLGFVGWLKQKLGNPLVNVACSLTSLAIITVLTKEGAIQDAQFSYVKVYQVLKMVIMGMIASALVNFLIKPLSARKEIREDLVKITDLLEEDLTTITRGFLSGSEDDLTDVAFRASQEKYRATFSSLMKNLRESRLEHYFLGTEAEYEIQLSLVKCIERLAHSLVGLRSAASTQFTLIAKSLHGSVASHSDDPLSSPIINPHHSRLDERIHSLTPIDEEPEDPTATPGSIGSTDVFFGSMASASGAADIFSLFISQLGPSMKSLAFTLKEVLNELPFGPAPDYDILINENFRSSVVDAGELFTRARREALDTLYKKRVLSKSSSPEIAADYEEVAASCGHFSSSLQDFAEDTVVYLDILVELKSVVIQSPRKRTWTWLRFWHPKKPVIPMNEEDEENPQLMNSSTRKMSQVILSPAQFQPPAEQMVVKYRKRGTMSFRFWRFLGFFRREDIKYAIKVGVGAVLFAMFSYIPSTIPTYSHWRGEWGLLSYMLVCSMTIGASNTTGVQRFLGTCIGAILALTVWFISNDNPFALGFFGWLVSLGCFYIILGQGKGPMGRFILLTYNLSALYAYSLSAQDDDHDDDEGGSTPQIREIVLHRVVAVMIGCIWGIIFTRVIWPISARRKVKDGIALLWLRMGLIWKRDPLQMLYDGDNRSSYMDIRESLELQRYLNHLESLRHSAAFEFDLRGPFRDKVYRNILESTSKMLGAFHAMEVVISKDLKASPGEEQLLRYTREERMQLSARISHLFSVLASSMKMEYPINDSLPNIDHPRDRLLTKLFTYRRDETGQNLATDKDFELLYAYALVTGQLAIELEEVGRSIEQLYGTLNEDSLKLR